jgi:hypothetical protein
MLERYIKNFYPECYISAMDGTSLPFGADVRLFGRSGLFGQLEDEVRTDGWKDSCKGCVNPDGRYASVHVPNRPNKTAHADFYIQYHEVTPFFWIAPMDVVRSWALTSTQACNNDDVEKFFDGANDAVDWYVLTDRVKPYRTTNRFEQWLKRKKDELI